MKLVSMEDVQNYYLSFFAGIQQPEGTNVEEITNEVSEDKNEDE